jgi:hypothetical protein
MSSKEASNNPGLCPVKGQTALLSRLLVDSIIWRHIFLVRRGRGRYT